ncbi:MAG: serine/threonine protein kinase, partial [Deltaproteobacteria bacterium HGW-Deltaproteobacteria-14]
MSDLAPGTRLGRYELIERLGVGGMAEVWAARQRGVGGFERRVALKRILPRFAGDPAFVERFAAEAHLAETLSHAHIASIYALEEVDGELVIAMELVRGETLQSIIRRAWELTGAPVPPALAAGVIGRVCRALQHAHTLGDPAGRPLGMVHRDISPSNVLLGYGGEVKLVDFGIARALSAFTAGMAGKAGYTSPEQARGDEVDPRADVFSAGVVLWELLTGMRLYGGMEAAATRAAVCAPEPARPVLEARPGLPPGLAMVVGRALQKDRAKRYPHAAAMASALEACARSLDDGGDHGVAELMNRLFKDRIERWDALLGAPAPTPAAARADAPAPADADAPAPADTPAPADAPAPALAEAPADADAPAPADADAPSLADAPAPADADAPSLADAPAPRSEEHT